MHALIGIKVLFDKIIKMATSQRHLASALKILSVDTKIHRNRLTVLFWLGITYIEKP